MTAYAVDLFAEARDGLHVDAERHAEVARALEDRRERLAAERLAAERSTGPEPETAVAAPVTAVACRWQCTWRSLVVGRIYVGVVRVVQHAKKVVVHQHLQINREREAKTEIPDFSVRFLHTTLDNKTAV